MGQGFDNNNDDDDVHMEMHAVYLNSGLNACFDNDHQLHWLFVNNL